LAAFGFIFFVVILAGFYLVNRERSKVQRLRGPRRFQPDWNRRSGTRRKRRRRRSESFRPGWSPRSARGDEPLDPSGEETETDRNG
jgi:hypothetical protein